jgi:alpha-tubulin suppressor-like RCC1 family protein
VTCQGKLLSWGYGASGCLGHGNANICTYPTPVEALAGEFVIYAESGGYHNAAVTESGDLWVWGRGDVHQLGVSFDLMTKDDIGHVAFRPIKTELKNVKGVACGEAHTVVLNSEGTVFAFGWAEDGQLGLYPDQLYENQMSFEISPLRIPEKVAKVSAGGLFSVALTEAGQLYVWGNCEQGQLGIGNRDKILRLPTHLSSMNNEIIMDMVCGETHVICITTTGKLYGWGQGLAGRFKNRQDFSTGSDIVCFVPRLLKEVDIVHRFVLKGRMDNLMEELTYKLQVLKYAM